MVERVLSLPRITRILIAGVFAVAVTLAISPIVDEIYLTYFYSPSTNYVPGLISAGLGVLMYGAGWFAIVGVVGEDLQARRIVLYYMIVGMAALLVVAIWLVRLLLMSSAI